MIAYIIKSSLSLLLLFGLYWFLLRREKLFVFNRFFLILSILFSLLIPYISFSVNIQANGTEKNLITLLNDKFPSLKYDQVPIAEISIRQSSEADKLTEAIPSGISFSQILLGVYILGFILSLFRFIKNIYNIYRQIHLSDSIIFSGKKLVLMDSEINPYCFFNTIFVCKNDYLNNKIAKEFLTHELEHIRQSHSIDIILLELIRIVYWFNPILYLYSRAIRVNHEYLADSGVLKESLDIEIYTDKLLSLFNCRETIPLSSGFNHSLMKKRLIMITKNKVRGIYSSLKIVMTLSMAITFFFILSCKPSITESANMSFIPQGQFVLPTVIGSDTIYQTVSVDAFLMSNEITNKEFREFTDWAKSNPEEILSKPKYIQRTVKDPKTGNMRDVVFTIPEFIYISDILPTLIDSTALYKLDKKYKNYFTAGKFDNFPVVGVSRNAAEYFCLWKTKSENTTRIEIEGENGTEIVTMSSKPSAYAYRLPLEMEWEYVAKQPIENKNASNKNSTIQESDAGNLNIWGLTHLEDNVSEWVSSSTETNGIVRGGSWRTFSNIHARRELDSNSKEGYIGFRIVQSYLSPNQVQNAVPPKIPASRTLNIILGPADKIYWYPGQVKEEDFGNLPPVREISFGPTGIRQMLLDRNIALARKINAFNNDILSSKIIMPEDSVQKVINGIKATDNTGPFILIKAYKGANYKNFVDILDEMNICGIAQYLFVDIAWYEEKMVQKAIAVSESVDAPRN